MTTARDSHQHVIAIDGPAAAGKTTVAQLLAERLDLMLFDTGALYRAVTLASLRNGVDLRDGPALASLAGLLDIDLCPPTVDDGRRYDVVLNGEDVTWAIRSSEVDLNVSRVSAHPEVRAALLQTQRDIAARRPVVMVGRDIASVVVPRAGVKIYLDASAEERARRRTLELRMRGEAPCFDDILADIVERDRFDSSRETAPLTVAEGAIRLETDFKSIPEVVDEIAGIASSVWSDDKA